MSTEESAKYPPQPYTQKLLDADIIRFKLNEEHKEYILVTYVPNDNFLLFFEEDKIYDLDEYYEYGIFLRYQAFFDDVDDLCVIGNVNDITICELPGS